MGDSITEGEVKELLKSKLFWWKEGRSACFGLVLIDFCLLLSVEVGDYVDLDEIVCSVETDKTQVPIRSPEAGVITELFAAEG